MYVPFDHGAEMISVELCHVYFDKHCPRKIEGYVEHHVQHSLEAYERWLDKNYRPRHSLCVLVDNQYARWPASSYAPFIAYLSKTINPDFLCFELDLDRKIDMMLAVTTHKNKIRKSINRGYDGFPQCTHYIAIWYYLRLGIIRNDDPFVVVPMSKRARKGEVQFHGNKAVSILSERNQEPEERAERELFSKCHYPIADLITRIYYPDWSGDA